MAKSSRLSRPSRVTPVDEADVLRIPVRVGNNTLNPASPFFYSHPPLAWDWNRETKEFLPRLAQHALKDGVNGVTATNVKGRVVFNSGKLDARLLNQGHTLIKASDARLGKHQNYLATYDVVDGRKWYVFWATTVSLIKGLAPEWHADAEEWLDFRRVVRDRIVGQIPEEGYDVLCRQMRAKLNNVTARIASSPIPNAIYQAEYDRIVADLKDMEVAMGLLADESEPAVPKKLTRGSRLASPETSDDSGE